jgi:hypothetical protein
MSNNSFLEKTSLNNLRNDINHIDIYLSLHLRENKFCPHSDPVRRLCTERKRQNHYYKCPEERSDNIKEAKICKTATVLFHVLKY